MVTIAGAILTNERGEYLLVQEYQPKARGMWNIPGGWQDEGETIKQTAIRETLEETGLQIAIADDEPFFTAENQFRGRKYNAFLGEVTGGSLQPPLGEIMAIKWLSFAAIEELYAGKNLRDDWIMDALTKAERA
ncbi:MAG: 8-oxo-dGDP phosphatase [Candidatus Saccharibacteria bacterium]|nr:8-oxo-dGDP phosphatase [Candidatus Saccharibacteria bacterium]